MRNTIGAAMVAMVLAAQSAMAGEPTPVTLAPIQHTAATLVVKAADGTERSYTPAELETLPTYSLTTTTPWRDEPAVLEGVLLADILAANGLIDADMIVVTAENDYATSVERDLFMGVDILVATRVNGQPHSRRARGPIQFVIDSETMASNDLAREGTLVWMAARIEAEG